MRPVALSKSGDRSGVWKTSGIDADEIKLIMQDANKESSVHHLKTNVTRSFRDN